ncbi:unnamed protein product [Mytilus coruscus]|uniref:EGF-like domain-containing protein n=1 Tax=Mytilus coruscus TaxID=42192 RepID=A0A6J8CF13_MYTCO|nr:unnamed protein product [Mytilus coruscus]
MTSELTVMDTSGTDNHLLDDSVRENQTTTTRSKTVRCRQKVEKWLPCVVVFMLICVVALLVAVLINLPKSDNTPQDSNNGVTSAQSSNKTTKHKEDNYCIHHTRSEFLENLPDDIDHLCKPQLVEEGTKKNWFRCPERGNFTQMFIPAYCMCDAKLQCIGSRDDRYQKYNCTTCRDKMHCPCQNNGKCETCPSRWQPKENKCICPIGTQGKYCTKINKRMCNLVFESDVFASYEMCNNSNNNTCLVKYNGNTLKCALSELSEHQRNCSDIDVKHGWNAFQVDRENPEKQKSSVVFPAKAILIVCTILIVGVLVIILLYMWRRRNSSEQPERV